MFDITKTLEIQTTDFVTLVHTCHIFMY